MALNLGSVLGGLLMQVIKNLRDWISAWWNRRRLEEEEQRRKAMEAYHEDRKEVDEAEEKIAEAGKKEAAQAAKEAETIKHSAMLEHLRANNP